MKLPNLPMLIKQKGPSLSRNLALGTLGKLSIVFLAKVNLLYLLYLKARRCFLFHLINQNRLLKTFLRTLILMTQVSLPVFHSRANLKLHNISVTFKMVKEIIINFDLSKASNPLCSRPVSLLSVVRKVFEKLVNNRIVDHPDKCGLFLDFHYGVRSS